MSRSTAGERLDTGSRRERKKSADMASSEIGEHLNHQEGKDPHALLDEVRVAKERGDSVLLVYRCLSVATAVSALFCGVMNAISSVRSFKSGQNVFVGILRCYAVVLAFFVAVAETEWERIFNFWKMLEFWVGRGMLQIFVAVMTKALSHASGETDLEGQLHEAAAWALFACGVLYVVSGLLCMGNLKRSRVKKAQWRDQAIKDLEEVERRRKELQGLLGDHV